MKEETAKIEEKRMKDKARSIVQNEHSLRNLAKDGHVVAEKIEIGNEIVERNGEKLMKTHKYIELDIDGERKSTNKRISKDFLSMQDKEYGTTLAQKMSNRDKEVRVRGEQDQEKKRDSLESIRRAEKILDQLTMKYCRERDYHKKGEELGKIIKGLKKESVQMIFQRMIYRSESPYISLLLFSKIEKGTFFLSNECVKQLIFLIRSFNEIYTETIPYEEILWELFKNSSTSDVEVQCAFELVGELFIDKRKREVLISLYGKIHIINYYREVCGGMLVQETRRSLLHAIIYGIQDKSVSKAPLSSLFQRLGEYTKENRVEKASVNMARGVWSLLKVHTDAFDEQFDDLLTYFTYFCRVFTESGCEIFTVEEVCEIADCIEVLANAILNRTVESSSADAAMDPLANYIRKIKTQKRSIRDIRIIPEMQDVQYIHPVQNSEGEDEASDGQEESSSGKEGETGKKESLKNVLLDERRMLAFNSTLKGLIKECTKEMKESQKSKKRATYDTFMYIFAKTKELYILVYLARICGIFDVNYSEISGIFIDISLPEKETSKEKKTLSSISNRIIAEKWKAIAYLTKEGVCAPPQEVFTKEIFDHSSPSLVFSNVSGIVELLPSPSFSEMISNGYIYDAIFLLTLPRFVSCSYFKESVKKVVSQLITGCHKEGLCLLARKLIELDGVYTESEAKVGDKPPVSPNDYIQVKGFVRETIASLFLTEIDVVGVLPPPKSSKITRTKGEYDMVKVLLTEEKLVNPETEEEDLRIEEKIFYKRVSSKQFETEKNIKTFFKNSQKGKNIDQVRKKIIFDFVSHINDPELSNRFANALVQLPSVFSLPEDFQSFLLSSLIILKDTVILSQGTQRKIKEHAQDILKNSKDEKLKDKCMVLSCLYTQKEETVPSNSLDTYEGLSLSLLIFITSKNGNLTDLKDAFFKICANLSEDQIEQLLLLFTEAGVETSPILKTKTSLLLEKYKKEKAGKSALFS
ncbi:hypothetical protein NEFER03_1643 [Nematocida sp. LUAm3]|nr:hypothetical protein NEFER03_1643 [Nematocida sp. LUAm3]KAI5174667.1 hypothetical protein NEFER02_0777 [Nematocida sp. LUAm2]KAI5177923.1 hypothetical protein NEFER01_1125 [Nematocida sp. LUAm1]